MNHIFAFMAMFDFGVAIGIDTHTFYSCFCFTHFVLIVKLVQYTYSKTVTIYFEFLLISLQGGGNESSSTIN